MPERFVCMKKEGVSAFKMAAVYIGTVVGAGLPQARRCSSSLTGLGMGHRRPCGCDPSFFRFRLYHHGSGECFTCAIPSRSDPT